MPSSRSAPRRASARAVDARRSTPPTRRLVIVVVLVGLAFGGVAARLAAVQVAGADQYRERGRDQRVDRVTLAAERGGIFDRDGLALAVSVPAETVWADPRVIDDPVGVAALLAPIVGVDEAALAGRLGQGERGFVYVARQVPDEVADQVRSLELPGIAFVPESRREYPADLLAAPVLGFVGTDNQGLGGLESQHESLLQGSPGKLVVERDPRGREIPSSTRRVAPPERGRDLVLTLDQSIQYEAEQVLVDHVEAAGAKGGTAIVMDVRTGDLLALASVEAGEQGVVPSPPTAANRGVTDVYEPGSTNKVITVAGALEDGTVAPDTHFSVPTAMELGGFTFEDHEPHTDAWWSVGDILRESSNIGTIMIGRTLGRERFDHYLRSFGFGTPTGLDFPGEPPGIILPIEHYNDSSMGAMPIGSGLAVTALQMVSVYATIAAGGLQREARLVSATIDAQGERIEEPAAPAREVVSAATATTVTDMLRAVVEEGTGGQAAVPGYPVAGKTGTARKPPYDDPPYRYVASFAGFAPADAPRLAVIVVIDEPSTSIFGGEVAAPAFARILQFALRQERVPPTEAVGSGEAAPSEVAPSEVAPHEVPVPPSVGTSEGADGTVAAPIPPASE